MPGGGGAGVSPVEDDEGVGAPGVPGSDDDGVSDGGPSFEADAVGVSPLLPHAMIKREQRAMSPSFKHHLREYGE